MSAWPYMQATCKGATSPVPAAKSTGAPSCSIQSASSSRPNCAAMCSGAVSKAGLGVGCRQRVSTVVELSKSANGCQASCS